MPRRFPARTLALAFVLTLVFAAQAAAAPSLTPAAVDLGDVPIGTSQVVAFTFLNDTDDALEINGAIGSSRLGSPHISGFGLNLTGPERNCSTLPTVPAHETCILKIQVHPTDLGTYLGHGIVFYGPDDISIESTIDLVSVVGLTLAPSPADFGTQPLFTLGVPQTIVATAHGAQTIGAATLGGASPSDFLLTENGCTGITLADQGTCGLKVRFAPSATGPRSATLSLAGGDQPGTTTLTGVGGDLPTGPPGVKGDTGGTGATGATGPAGATGSTGPTGPIGPQGPDGDDGAAGTNGPAGLDGANGPNGANGANGADGRDGASALSTQAASRPLAAQLVTTRRALRLAGDSIAVRVRCAAPGTGTVTLRTANAIRGARRTLGTGAFSCAGGTRTVHVIVRSAMRKLLRRHGRAVRLRASVAAANGSGLATSVAALRLGAVR